jgi:NDP-sugar pyrophosphorylase family protein
MKAVILAGGLGTRLAPFTQVIPKPLLPLGESSVLEVQIAGLERAGFDDIYIATNYRADYVQAFLGDGSKYGVRLTFSRESRPLGTCGPVLLLRDALTEPFLLLNGDILTTLSFDQVYRFALARGADLTVVTKEIVTPFHFGAVETEGDFLLRVEEKPDFKLEIVCGIYVLTPEVLELVPEGTYYGIDALIKAMLASGRKVARFLTTDYWLDIGRVEDYRQAQDVYQERFGHLAAPRVSP